ncbi:MAG TPA: glycosyltransferase family 9 protein, partial [Dehalococcoidia bacterium]|nr:glycosyltransferase family 9 protein [Dehalococcoidia bacterium]
MADPRWAGVRNVLAVRLDSMGDVLMMTPALRALKTAPGLEDLGVSAVVTAARQGTSQVGSRPRPEGRGMDEAGLRHRPGGRGIGEMGAPSRPEGRGMDGAGLRHRPEDRGMSGRKVTLLTSSAGARVAGMLPDVDDVMVYDAPWMKATPSRDSADAESEIVHRLQEGRFDAAVILTTFSQSPLPAAMLCYLSGIPLRLAHCHENTYQLLTDYVPDPEPERFVRHEVQRQLDLVSHIDCRTTDERLSMTPPPEAMARVVALLADAEVDTSRPWVLIHPGSTASSRRYSHEGYAEAAGTLVRDHGYQVVFSGDASERPLVEAIQTRMAAPSVSLAGRTSIEELAALIHVAPALISNNTGPVHMAAALQTPVV